MKICMIAFAVMMMLFEVSPVVPYRILHIERNGENGDAYCVISLNRYVKVEQFKGVICDVICKEKLSEYDTLAVQVVHGRNEYVAVIGNDPSGESGHGYLTQVDNLFLQPSFNDSEAGWL